MFSKGVFRRNSHGLPPGQPAGAPPPPAPSRRAGRRELGFPRRPRALAARAPPASARRPFPLAEKGKSARPGSCGLERVRAEGEPVLRGEPKCPGRPYKPGRPRRREKGLLSGRSTSQAVARLLGTRGLLREKQAPGSSFSLPPKGGWNF